MNDKIIIKGAKEHNLKNINVEIPRDKLVVITGLSGSGKSSLAFDTIYAEGQRRYVESLSSYARQFLGVMEKPNVDKIEGLSPAISIDQKTTSKNPRSTVGTVTEIYDYIRLLYARIGTPYCPNCNKKIEKQTLDQIVDKVMQLEEGTRIQVLAPVVRDHKGEFAKEIEQFRKSGFARVRIDEEIYDLSEEIKIEKNKKHYVEIVIDRLIIRDDIKSRLTESIETALSQANKLVVINVMSKYDENEKILNEIGVKTAKDNSKEILFSCNYACPDCGFSFPEITPRMFSFNNPMGACPSCLGIGYLMKMDEDLIIPDKSKTLYDGVKAFGASTMKKGDTMADWFDKQIGRLYLVEAECFLKGLSAEETKYRRNRREVTRILESIKSKAEELLSRQRIHYSPSLRRALNYMKRGWENLIRYREDGDYSIDNSIAERAVRPYTVFRNGTMFHGSERGVENTTFFYSLIETGKARGLNVKNYLVSMIREMLHGNKDYKGILQGAYI